MPDVNFTMDPEALRVLLEETDVPVTAMLFEVTSTTVITLAQLRRLAARRRAGRYFAQASAPNLRAFGDAQPFDANVVYRMLAPRAYRCFESGFELRIAQPSAQPVSGNVDAFRPDLPGRRVEACHAFAGAADPVRFVEAVLDGVG